LFSYGLNNPISFSDPNGHDPCNKHGINPKTGAFCTVGKAKAPEAPTLLSQLGTLVPAILTISIQVTSQSVQQPIQSLFDWISQPRDPWCLAGSVGAGAGTGAVAGLAGGPGGVVTVPAGFLTGGLTSGGIGMVTCRNAGGPTGGGNADGGNGTQVTSKTLWKDGKGARIDVENPNPAQRPGQIHYQDQAGKYLYNPQTGQFDGAPRRVNQLLSDPRVQAAIRTGLRYLGL
jgi:hypothetical protein